MEEAGFGVGGTESAVFQVCEVGAGEAAGDVEEVIDVVDGAVPVGDGVDDADAGKLVGGVAAVVQGAISVAAEDLALGDWGEGGFGRGGESSGREGEDRGDG